MSPSPENGDGQAVGGLLVHNIAQSMDDCLAALKTLRHHVVAPPDATVPWCNATWDTVLCWPATPANSSALLRCPPLKGLDPSKLLHKVCDVHGAWLGKDDGAKTNVTAVHGWTNFTMCFTEEVLEMMRNLQGGSISTAQQIAKNARKLEFVGLGLSFVSLSLCIFIFAYFRRLRSFRNLLHLQLMVAILMVVIIRLILYIDLIFTDKLGSVQTLPVGRTINTMRYVCESMYLMLEYFKTVAFQWMFLEGWYLHNTLVFTVFSSDPKIHQYMMVGYGSSLIHTATWFLAVLLKRGSVERCLGSYYLEHEFWILDGPRMLELCLNFVFICNVIRVLWTKVRDSHDASEMERMWKSVKAALMLIPLLGIPNILQTIPFTPTKQNITFFAVWTYLASFTYMFQGFMVATLFCFTNREVINVIKQSYSRYRLQHSSAEGLRRHSKAAVRAHFITSNGAANNAGTAPTGVPGTSSGSARAAMATGGGIKGNPSLLTALHTNMNSGNTDAYNTNQLAFGSNKTAPIGNHAELHERNGELPTISPPDYDSVVNHDRHPLGGSQSARATASAYSNSSVLGGQRANGGYTTVPTNTSNESLEEGDGIGGSPPIAGNRCSTTDYSESELVPLRVGDPRDHFLNRPDSPQQDDAAGHRCDSPLQVMSTCDGN